MKPTEEHGNTYARAFILPWIPWQIFCLYSAVPVLVILTDHINGVFRNFHHQVLVRDNGLATQA